MKKIIFGLILFIVPFTVVINLNENDINAPVQKILKDDIWERIKIQVYEHGKHKQRPIFKYKGPILFKLNRAKKIDSLAFENVIKELKTLFPSQEIHFFSDFTGKSFEDITLNTPPRREDVMGSSTTKNDAFIHGYSLYFLKRYTIQFNFNEDNRNEVTKRVTSINSDNSLGHFNYYKSNRAKENSGYLDSSTDFNFGTDVTVDFRAKMMKNVIFKILSANSFALPKDFLFIKIHSSDEKVLQRFYSPNFEEEFKAYMFKTYPWRYAINFLNKEKTEILTNWLCVIIGLVLTLLGLAIFYKIRFKIRFFNYSVPLLALTYCALTVFLTYEFFTNSIHFQRSKDVFGIYIIFTTVALIMSLFLWIFDTYVIKKEMNFIFQFGLKIGFTFFIFLVPIAIVYVIESNSYSWVTRVSPILLGAITLTLGRGLLLYLDHYSENLIKEKDIELSKLKEINAQAEVKLLQSQINPHFLYNALNSIASLAHKNADKTEKMALSLSDLFKYTINRKGKKDSTIGDEVEMVANYLEVEQIRFDDRLNFTIEVDKTLENTKIPMFLIQPLIENAVKHGISKVENDGQISLSIQKIDVGFTILVEDNGPDFPEGVVSGHGLQTVFDLLRLTYNDKASISWKNKPNKQIKITIEN
ncbi:histidine kinase [Cellulophaga sp. F20128]|uniref:sensor histidine kinase n=1 Tax=Cellulophaga sp. F20128 TaxID=2926413 RepID=UPI001FF2C9FA|nr:histidine kinase [Cellulophaga sp. F20128]MCK0158949.1 histidine kinase [Cellulophaga sp. F20128]